MRNVRTFALVLAVQLLQSLARAEGGERSANDLPTGADSKPSRISGDSDSRASYADHLFRDGIKLMKSDNCPQAVLKFQASAQLDPSAATLMNMATCYARLGRTATAWRMYEDAASAAGKEGSEELRDQAFKAISILAPTLTMLKVVPPQGATAMVLTLNGEPLGESNGLPIALDPGENIVEATLPGRPPWRRTVNANELGATIVIEVPEMSDPRTNADAKSGLNWRAAALIAGGAGIVVIAVGLALGLSAKSTYDDAAQYCRDGRCNSTGHDLRETAMGRADLSTISVGVGALLTVGSVGLWFASPTAPRQELGLVPWLPKPQPALGLTVNGKL